MGTGYDGRHTDMGGPDGLVQIGLIKQNSARFLVDVKPPRLELQIVEGVDNRVLDEGAPRVCSVKLRMR
jgi:hypothetical protein